MTARGNGLGLVAGGRPRTSAGGGPVQSPRPVARRATTVDEQPPLARCEPRLREVAVRFPARVLFLWNGSMAGFHFLLLILTLSLAKLELTIPVYYTRLLFQVYANETFATVPPGQEAGELLGEAEALAFRLMPVYRKAGDLPVTLATGLFFFLSFLFHALNATCLRSFYERELAACRSPTRWVEYSLSAPVMFLIIAYSLGVRSVELLSALCVLVCVTMFFGYWVEVNARPLSESRWEKTFAERLYPWALGHVPQVAAWAIVVAHLYAGADDLDRVPWFVHLVLWGELVLFFSFGAASIVSQYGPPSHFYKGELLFQVLSLVSKGLLGIVLLSNVLMLSRFDDIYKGG